MTSGLDFAALAPASRGGHENHDALAFCANGLAIELCVSRTPALFCPAVSSYLALRHLASPCPALLQLFPLSRPDFVKEVTEASKEVPVVVLLYKDSIQDSRLLEAVMQRVCASCRNLDGSS